MANMTISYPPLPQIAPFTPGSAYSSSYSGYNFTSTTSRKPLPPTLWRIYNDTSVSRRLPDGGFLAGSPDRTIDMSNPQIVGVEIKLHLNWYCPAKTVFISSSQNFRWIQYHAIKRELKGRKNVRVSQINTARAVECGAEIFHIVALSEFTGRNIPQRAAKSAQDEWVFLTEIPSWGVVADYSAQEFAALRSPQFRTGHAKDWDPRVIPEVQYPMQNSWGSSQFVPQPYNMGYGQGWQNINPNPGLWYPYYATLNSYTWQGPFGPSPFLPPATLPDRNGNGDTPAFTGQTVSSDIPFTGGERGKLTDTAEALNPRSIAGRRRSVTLPTTASAGSSINYPTLPEPPSTSKIATTHKHVEAAVQYWGSIYGHADYRDKRLETGYGTGDERYGGGGSEHAELYARYEGGDSEHEELYERYEGGDSESYCGSELGAAELTHAEHWDDFVVR